MAHRILVVEDEQHLAVGLRFNLEAEGYVVSIAEDGPTALRELQDESKKFDLVILDIMLPGMSGYDVCKSARSNGSALPILMLSARNLAEDRARGFDVGADQYLSKPFELDELLSRVKSLINRFQTPTTAVGNGAASANTAKIGDVVIDFDAYQISQVDGSFQRLTALEIKLLRYFLDNEGRVIPRWELLEEVWQMSGEANSRAPDQFIRRLRKIFEPDPSHPKFFQTIRDGGYRFIRKVEA